MVDGSIKYLTKPRRLDIYNNQLEGPLNEMGRPMTLQYLDLNSNVFQMLPREIVTVSHKKDI